MRQVLKQLIYYSIFLYAYITNAEIYQPRPEEKLKVKISKSGLNRISNPPYKIVQVTGDDSKFRLKYDEDGTNIYFMPLSKQGENIEISIKNNAGFVQDLQLLVSNIKGRSIIIDGKTTELLELPQKNDIAEMLRAMKDRVNGKFYVQSTNQMFGAIGVLTLKQTKTYKYKNLVGGVFEVNNPTKNLIKFDVSNFAKGFDNVKTSYPNLAEIYPKQKITVLVVQKLAEK